MQDANRLTLARHMATQVDGLTVHLASAAIDAFLEGVGQTLAEGGSVRLAGFGTFSVRYRKARQTLHPKTRQPIQIAAARLPTFSPGILLRRRLLDPPAVSNGSRA